MREKRIIFRNPMYLVQVEVKWWKFKWWRTVFAHGLLERAEEFYKIAHKIKFQDK